MLVLRMHPSLRQTQGTVTVVQGPCDGSWLLGSTARWDTGLLAG